MITTNLERHLACAPLIWSSRIALFSNLLILIHCCSFTIWVFDWAIWVILAPINSAGPINLYTILTYEISYLNPGWYQFLSKNVINIPIAIFVVNKYQTDNNTDFKEMPIYHELGSISGKIICKYRLIQVTILISIIKILTVPIIYLYRL